MIRNGNSLDGVTFRVIVHRLQDPPPNAGGEWLVRVYLGDEHIHSAEGGVPYLVGLKEAQRAMGEWVEKNGGGERQRGWAEAVAMEDKHER